MSQEFFDKALVMLVREEGKRLHPYDDRTGKPVALAKWEGTHFVATGGNATIGIGRNISRNGLSDSEVLYLFENDLRRVVEESHSLFGDVYFESLSLPRQLAIVNMLFAFGKPGFQEWAPTILLIQRGLWKEVSVHVRGSRWARVEAPRRAERVAVMFEEDRWVY